MWTPRRIFLSLVGLLAAATLYFGYAQFLGSFDGLPPLPREYYEDGSGGDPFPYARDVSRLDFYSLTDHLNVRGEALNNMGKVGNDYGEGD